MLRRFRPFARRVLGVRRAPTYYLPWLVRPGLDCVLVINNVESRFKAGHNQGPFPVSAVQYDADGAVVRRWDLALADNGDIAEIVVEGADGGCGFVAVDDSRLLSDHYASLSDGETYCATHGRHEFIETYPARTRVLAAVAGAALALVGRTIPAFTRDQYVYAGGGCRTHLLLLNLSNMTNRIRARLSNGGDEVGARLLTLPPMGARLFDPTTLARDRGDGIVAHHLRLQGNAWFNLYVIGTGPRALAGPLSLMHVK